MEFDVMIIGSGPGGYVAAVRSSQLGFSTAIVERENLGGICLNWGCIPTKALLKSAQVFNYMKHSADYGIRLEGSVEPDMNAIVDRSRTVAANMGKGVQYLMQKNNVTVIEGEARLNSDKSVAVTLKDGTEHVYSAKHIILATGARSRNLPNMPQDGKKIIGYRQAMTLRERPESMVVVGSGAIGSEFAHFYQSIGTKVTLVEYMPNIVPNEDEEVSSTLQRCFKKNGMKVLTSTSVESVDTTADKCVVKLNGKKGEQTIECDVVLSAVGVSTNIENIGLEEAGVAVEKGKVVVDDFYRTNVEGIYAIGDIVHGPALAHVASREAIVCVEAIKGMAVEKIDYSNIPGCTYTTPEVASVGLTQAKAEAAGFQVRVGKFMYMASGKAAASGNRDGFVKVVIDKDTDRILGCHMIGDNVTEMIEEMVLARQSGIKACELVEAVHPHPTMSEAVMEAVEAAYGKAIHG
ncbi:MAG TPA: dihydrolipoyl dehydrogenase [Candidatus Onthomorpha intestinigallinarum]|uniref:Dihydrolipoyl dehydrogenase n=1 Tax=Candidatus Onthomorpha intestinigallinarum TaxID=2840880 RepID=A0A9D1UGH8_9BACT|nr:dihydrolipoyl dehydrogenase [Candidatus Onthomorpha intestinigallinarum]